MYKVFPCRADKTPLISGWQEAATNDVSRLQEWQRIFGAQIAHWGVPTGAANGLLVLDIDVKKVNGYQTLEQHNLFVPDSRSQITKSGGSHVFFAYPRTGKVYGNRVNLLPGIDVRGDGGYVCYYDDSQSDKPLAEAPDWLVNGIVKPTLEVTGTPVKVSPQIAHETLTKSLAAIAQAAEGESNAVLNSEAFRIGQLVKSGALERVFAFEQLFGVAVLRKGSGTEYECKRTIESGFDGGDKKPLTSPFDTASNVLQFTPPPLPEPPGLPARWTPPQFTRQQLLDKSKLRKPQLFEDWSTEDIHITTADGGTGKTTLKLYEAIHLALGERFLGFDCKQKGKTLFITGEDTAPKLASMLGVIMREMGLLEEGEGNEEKVQTVLSSVLVKKDADLCLVQKNKATGFLEPSVDAIRKLSEAIEDIQPKMIVFDPISSFWGSENALNDMNKAVTKFASEIVEKHNVCFEMINHMGKQSSSNKDMTQFAGRGGTGLPSNSRVSRVFRRIDENEYRELTGDDQEPDTDAILVNVNKFTDGSPLYNKPFIILRDGYTFSRIQLSKNKQEDVQAQGTDYERVFAFVKETIAKGRHATRSVCVAHFDYQKEKMSRDRVNKALVHLGFEGHLGEFVKSVQGPDLSSKEQILVIQDAEGREL